MAKWPIAKFKKVFDIINYRLVKCIMNNCHRKYTVAENYCVTWTELGAGTGELTH